jgi:hypothetical protein
MMNARDENMGPGGGVKTQRGGRGRGAPAAAASSKCIPCGLLGDVAPFCDADHLRQLAVTPGAPQAAAAPYDIAMVDRDEREWRDNRGASRWTEVVIWIGAFTVRWMRIVLGFFHASWSQSLTCRAFGCFGYRPWSGPP